MAPADPHDAAEPSVDAVASEIRIVVGRVRSPAGLVESDLPVLDALAGARSAVPELIAVAIERITSEQYREFLTALLPFPFEPAAPWEQLGPNRRSDGRGERASRAAFGLSWDACNRPGQLLDGRSRRDWAERFLAESILAGVAGMPPETVSPETVSPETVPPETVPPETVPPRAGRPTRGMALAALVVGALAVVVGVFVLRDDSSAQEAPAEHDTPADQGARDGSTPVDGGSTTSAAPISCAPIGSLNSIASTEYNAADLTQHFIDLYSTLPESVGCPADPAFIWDELAVQELESDEPDLPGAMLVERTSGTAVYLTPTAYGRYRTLGSGDGSIAQSLGGLPSEVVTLPDGHQEVLLSKGVLLVAEREGAPFFWVPAGFLELYRARPDLGYPVGNPLPSLVQDYQRGFGQLYQKEAVPEITVLDDPGAELPAIDDLARTVLRQADGTAWFIGADGKRYWIPTGGVWECLVQGRDDQVRTARAYAIATLPYGGHAECRE